MALENVEGGVAGLFGQVGNFSSVKVNHANELWMAAARNPARSEPANSQFFLPSAIGRFPQDYYLSEYPSDWA